MSTSFINSVIDAGTDGFYEAQLVDRMGIDITKPSVISISATVTDLATATVLRDAQDVKDVNGGTLTDGGMFYLTLDGTLDTKELAGGRRQKRRLKLRVVFNGGVKTHTVHFFVRSVD